MKTVYSSDMVCHLWANGHAVDVRTSSGNLYTQGGALYSYGRHHIIGAFVQGKAGRVLLMNENTYSATTAKHASKARRALPPEARAIVATVPTLDAGSVGDLAGLAYACERAAVAPLEKCEKARENLTHHIHAARVWFDSARRIYEAMGDKKGAASVPTLASDAGKPEAARILAEINRATYTATLKKEIESARLIVETVRLIDTPTPNARHIMRMIDRAVSHAKNARANVTRAGLKRPPVALAQIEKALQGMAAQWQGPADIEQAREDADDIARMLQTLREELKENQKLKGTGKANRSISWAMGRLSDAMPRTLDGNRGHAVAMWGDEAPARFAEVQTVLRRARAVDNAQIMARALKDTGETIAAFLAVGATRANVPSGATLRQRVAMWEGCPAFWSRRALSMAATADALKASHLERVARENAEKITAWRAGERVSLPRDVGPLVRIEGDTVATSWGARVPLDHAARLLKIARRAHAEGGKVYAHGEGPAVGHFRVNSIAPDFSMVIGCHPFTAEECHHAARLIDAATACAEGATS